jgi:hypothetical protein
VNALGLEVLSELLVIVVEPAWILVRSSNVSLNDIISVFEVEFEACASMKKSLVLDGGRHNPSTILGIIRICVDLITKIYTYS